MTFLPGKNQLLSLNVHGTIQSTVTGLSLLEFHEHNNTVSAVDVAPFTKFADKPGTFVATAGGDEKEIYIWNADDGTIVRKFGSHGHGIFATGASTNQVYMAYGQSNPTGILDDAPLEKSLNLTDFSLKDITATDKFQRHDLEYMGSKIHKESAHVLNYGTGTISIDEQKDGEIRSYTFLKDHNMIAIGSTFGIPLFDRSGKPVSKLLGHGGELWSVCPFASNMLLSSSADQTIKIWNYTTQELLLTFFPANDREWVIWSPSGYYHASAGGEKYIGWLINKTENDLAEFHEVSEFRDKYHNPELIKAILKEQSLEKASKLLNIVVAKPDDILKLLPPEITWIEPSGYTGTTSSPLYNIKASIKSNNPVKSLKLIINGRPYVTKMEDFRIEKTDNGMTIQYALDFTKVSVQARGLEVVAASEVDHIKKEVSIQIFVENEISGIVTDARTVLYQQQSDNRVTPQPNNKTGSSDRNETVAAFPNLYLITIGISSFQNPAYNLNYADDDARSIEAVFKDQQGKLFNKVYSLSLINENATRAKIISTFDRLKPVVSAHDYVVIFIATHGINKNNQFYILPHDGDATKANITCVNWRDFSDVVGNLPSQVLLMIDACHSGQLGKNLGQISSDNTEAVREISSGEYGVVIMAASTGSEYSLEHPDWAHGAFTLSIIEGLQNRKADIRPDGAIFLRELDFYVAERVKDLTQNQQHPTTQKPSTISAMPIIKY
jgi:WD40 repeat protein